MIIIIKRHGQIQVRNDKGIRLREDWKKSATDTAMQNMIVSIQGVDGTNWTGRLAEISSIIEDTPVKEDKSPRFVIKNVVKNSIWAGEGTGIFKNRQEAEAELDLQILALPEEKKKKAREVYKIETM